MNDLFATVKRGELWLVKRY